MKSFKQFVLEAKRDNNARALKLVYKKGVKDKG